jgi:hypothetical protein
MAGNDEGCSAACCCKRPENTVEHFNMGPIPIPWKFREVFSEVIQEMPNIEEGLAPLSRRNIVLS